MNRAKRDATLWYQVRVTTPLEVKLVTVMLQTVSEKDGFKKRPDLSVFEASRACIFIDGWEPYLRVEISPIAFARQDKHKFPLVSVHALKPYGWKAKDFAMFPMTVLYDGVVFKEPIDLAMDHQKPFLFCVKEALLQAEREKEKEKEKERDRCKARGESKDRNRSPSADEARGKVGRTGTLTRFRSSLIRRGR
ncbi:M [San Jacinto virus]|uniref:M n=1 Tax=San Jacinto virus TaxID=2596788 RepID=A0A516EL23_9MONO|nr:M [San Jacinto virus] [San Jacinto virus]QDO67014.1 M [San Jacinto virus] [San Jacinto virus]QFQ60717.1 matrix protein [San Jacinto virus]